jgi:hypothetical protein
MPFKELHFITIAKLCLALFVLSDSPLNRATSLQQPVRDTVYLQESGRKVATPKALTALAVFKDKLFVASASGVAVLKDDQLIDTPDFSIPVSRLIATSNALWAIGNPGLYRWQNDLWQKISTERVSDLTEHNGKVIVALARKLAVIEANILKPLTGKDGPFPIARVISHCETLYVQGAGRLTLFDGEQIGGRNVYEWASDEAWDWGNLPSRTIKGAISHGRRLYLATDRGLGLLQGMSLTQIRGEQGLCYEDTTCLSLGFNNDLWIGTTRGAIRMIDGTFHYFAGQRWLPHDQVNAIASQENRVYIATEKGLAIIDYEPFTLHPSEKGSLLRTTPRGVGTETPGLHSQTRMGQGTQRVCARDQ